MAPVPALSTAINTVAYDPRARVLQVQYAGGKGLLYRYHGVPPELFDEFTQAWALGTFLNERVKPVYAFERLSFEQAAERPLSDVTKHWHQPLVGGFTKARWARRRRARSGRRVARRTARRTARRSPRGERRRGSSARPARRAARS